MDSCTVEVIIMFGFSVRWASPYDYVISCVDVWNDMPSLTRSMLEAHLLNDIQLTDKEHWNMYESCVRSIGFEVEVDYVVQADGSIKAKNATLQTVFDGPNYVKGWLEQEAMKMVEKEVPCASKP